MVNVRQIKDVGFNFSIYICKTFRERNVMATSLKEEIRNGEGPQLEFKKTISHLEKIAKTLVSFANAKGGKILVGVQDDRYVIGIQDAEEEKYMLQQAATFYCKPEVKLLISEEEVYGKTVLVVEVPESQHKPHRCQTGQGEWVLYVRSGDQCLLASPEVARSLEMEKETREKLAPKQITNNERMLFWFLSERQRITLKDYAKLINVSKRRAYKILITQTLAGNLYMHDMEKTVFFTRA